MTTQTRPKNVPATDKDPRRRIGWPVALLVAAALVLGASGFGVRAALASGDPRYLSAARSIELLNGTLGPVADRPLDAGRVVMVANDAALLRRSDDINTANRAHNPRTGRTWAAGDAAAMWPDGLQGLFDFATRDIYINKATATAATTPHELLHANSSLEFASAVGTAINEGLTELLTLEATAAAGLRGPAGAYPRERALVTELMRITGRDRLLRAYFNGGSSLSEVIDAIGADTFKAVKGAALGGNTDRAIALLNPAFSSPPPAVAAAADTQDRPNPSQPSPDTESYDNEEVRSQ